MTAVEWLVSELKHCKEANGFIVVTPSLLNMLEQKAKAMEKKIIIDSYCEGFKKSGEGWNGEYGIEDFNKLSEEIQAEDYYNKTYNK